MHMFNTEQLQEKWAPVLDHDGMDPIKDSHRRAVTAILLENQERAVNEEREFLSEQPTNATQSTSTVAGFSASADAPVAGFDPVLISLIRRSMPNLVAYDLAGVQPMNGPTGLIFAMRSKFQSMGGSEALFDEADTSFSGQNAGFDLEGTRYVSGGGGEAVGFGTTGPTSANNPGLLNPEGSQSATTYPVGQGMGTAESEDLCTSGDDFNQMAFSIE